MRKEQCLVKKRKLATFWPFCTLGRGTKEKEKPRNLEAFKTWIFRRPYRAPPKNQKLYFELSPPRHPYVLLLAYLLAFYLAYLLAFYLAYLMAFYLANLLAYVRANILALYLAFYLAYLLAFYLANILALYPAYLLAFFLTFYLAFYLAYLLAFYLAVEAQRCSLSSEGPRLRPSGAHFMRTLAKSWQSGSEHGSGCWDGRRGGGGSGGEVASRGGEQLW